MQWRIAPQLLCWRRAAMCSHSLSCQRTLQCARGDYPCIDAQARHPSSFWVGGKPSSVQRALPLYPCTGDLLQGTPPPEKHTLQSAPTLTPTPTPMPTPTSTPRLKLALKTKSKFSNFFKIGIKSKKINYGHVQT
jgi:hypothetical protein